MSELWKELLARPLPIRLPEASDYDDEQPPVGAPSPLAAVPRRPASSLSVEEFVRDFMAPNLPVIITEVAQDWRASREWVQSDGALDLAALERRFGAAQVAAVDSAPRHQGDGPCTHMSLGQVIACWRRQLERQQGQQEQRSEAQPKSWAEAPAGQAGMAREGAEEALLYVKDWHLASEFPDYQAYACPPHFQDDWLNEFYDHKRAQRGAEQQRQQVEQQRTRQHEADGSSTAPPSSPTLGGSVVTSDYRFAYIGPRGSSTPLHADVLRSYSWSANVAGLKLWRLLPPQYTRLCLDATGRSMAHDLFADQASPEAAARWPRLRHARQHMLEVVQEPGEAIFVPSGWFHTVDNLSRGGVASLNHNWFNGHNIAWVWGLLEREYREAAQGIEDCRELCSPSEFEGLVQRNLGANAGLDWAQFGELLRWVSRSAAARLQAGWPGPPADISVPSAVSAEPAALRLVFRLQRAGWALGQLLEHQRRVQACSQQVQASSGAGVGSVAPDGAPPYAADAEANAACLLDIRRELERVGMAHVLPPGS